MSEVSSPIPSRLVPIVKKYIDLWKAKGWKAPAVDHDEVRDFYGYGTEVPNISWPGNKKIAVTFVLNFEEGSEFSIGDGDLQNEGIYEVIDCEKGARDFCIESHFEYGTRVGYWRVVDAFDRYNAKMTVSSCGRAVERSPWLIKDAFSRGHEIAGHGYRWQTHANMSEEEEAEAISKCVEVIKNAVGKPPVGWHTRSERSKATRRLLIERGFIYSDDAYNDETPYFVKVNEHLHLILPYAFDTNDMQFQNTNRFNTASSFTQYVCDSFDWLANRETSIPRMMTIGLHLRMITRPGRMPALEAILDHISKSNTAWIATREQVARHWLEMTSVDALSLRVSPSPLSSPLLRVNPELFPHNSNPHIRIQSKPFNLLIINPNTTQSATDLIVNHVKKVLSDDVSITGLTAVSGSPVICSEVSFIRASNALLDTFIEYENSESYVQPDAVMVGCFGDTGVYGLREYLREKGFTIPVLGLAEAAMKQAAERGGKFAIITGGAAWKPILTRLAKGWDLLNFLSEIHTLSLNGAQLAADRQAAVEMLSDACKLAIVAGNGKANSLNDRISSIILGGGLLAGMADDITNLNLGVPIIDSVTAGVEMIIKSLNSEPFRLSLNQN